MSVEPFDSFSDRFLEAAQHGAHDLIVVSQVLFGSGRILDHLEELSAIGRPEGPWVVIDGYCGQLHDWVSLRIDATSFEIEEDNFLGSV